MTIREAFEREFPVPNFLYWEGVYNTYGITIQEQDNATAQMEYRVYAEYRSRWIGFQAGWKAAKESVE